MHFPCNRSFPIAKALNNGAEVVVTGRCVDSALTLGPLIHKVWYLNLYAFEIIHFGTAVWMDSKGLGPTGSRKVTLSLSVTKFLTFCSSLAGHLVECGAQATGGIFTDWNKVNGW